MSETEALKLSPQHVQSFLETSASYLGRRPEANRSQENGPFAGVPDAGGLRRDGSNSGTSS
jgi:hypothetical protein